MIKLCLTDKLLIQPVTPILSWGYRIRYIAATSTTIATETGLTALYREVTLSSATYLTYVGRELFVEVLNNLGVVVERGSFTISGIYNKIQSIKRLTQLLGENVQKMAADTADWQDGYLRNQDITTYTSSALVTEVDNYNWTQTFDTDFTPDARYQTAKVISKEVV